jgi:hypothetical protein
MAFLSKIRGTFEALFQVGKGGPQLKNNGGVVELRSAGDTAFVITRAADPTGADDLVTKRYGDTTYLGGARTYATGSFSLADGQFVVMTKELALTTNQRVTLSGTARIRVT